MLRQTQRAWVVCLHFFDMGLNHHIGSLLNYRLLLLSQRHHAISEAVLCSGVWLLLGFLGRCACYVLCLSEAACSLKSILLYQAPLFLHVVHYIEYNSIIKAFACI